MSWREKQKSRENVEGLVRDLGEQLSGYQSELSGDFKKALSNDEERQLERVMGELPDLRKQVAEIGGQTTELESRKSVLEGELRENLRLRLDQLQSVDVDAGVNREGTSSTRLGGAEERSQAHFCRPRFPHQSSSARTRARSNQRNLLSKLQRRPATKSPPLPTASANPSRISKPPLNKTANKRAALQTRLTDVATSIRSLGALPDAFNKPPYTTMASNVATSRLHKVQETLKKYGHVNKKAFEQFAQSEKQREVLEQRRSELDGSDKSIRELIEHLDLRKDEAIERTFRQVSREFARIFERLVPAGKGRLIIQRRSDRRSGRQANGDVSDEEDGEGDIEREGGGGVENYTGVGISVSFNSKHDEQQRIQQLSRRAEIALRARARLRDSSFRSCALLPFDEIDANLDSQYRTAVAELLHESSSGGEVNGSQGGPGEAQFICTTFRPEMLLVAEKCYGVSYLHKASSIDVVSREQALDFVEGQVSGGK